jgi:hypothetical protein
MNTPSMEPTSCRDIGSTSKYSKCAFSKLFPPKKPKLILSGPPEDGVVESWEIHTKIEKPILDDPIHKCGSEVN